jgi:hypothetical protein
VITNPRLETLLLERNSGRICPITDLNFRSRSKRSHITGPPKILIDSSKNPGRAKKSRNEVINACPLGPLFVVK